MVTKLDFRIYTYGDGYLKAMVGDNSGYTICNDENDSNYFKVFYFIKSDDYIGGKKYENLGSYPSLYGALDAANAHYEYSQLAEEDKYVMPERRELEVFDGEPVSTRRVYIQEFN